MKIQRRIGWLMPLLLMAVCQSPAQAGSTPGSAAQMLVSGSLSSSSMPASALSSVQGEVLREIDDPHTGDCWLLLRDPAHPAGPGRLVLTGLGKRSVPVMLPAEARALLPVIRSGERVVLEGHSAVADVRLEASAMGPARIGDSFSARMTIGGRIVKAVALGPGHAVVQESTR